MDYDYLNNYAFSHLYNFFISSEATFSPKLSTDSVSQQTKGENHILHVNHNEVRHRPVDMIVDILMKIRISILY